MKTIDITPTWESLALILAELAISPATPVKARQTAKEELIRMAKIADAHVASKKKNKN